MKGRHGQIFFDSEYLVLFYFFYDLNQVIALAKSLPDAFQDDFVFKKTSLLDIIELFPRNIATTLRICVDAD